MIYLTWFRDVSEKYHHLNHSFSFSSFTPGTFFVTAPTPDISPSLELPSVPSEKIIRSCYKLIQQQQFCILSLRLLIRSYKSDLTQLLTASNLTFPPPPPPPLTPDLKTKSKQILLQSELLSQDLSQCVHQIDHLCYRAMR